MPAQNPAIVAPVMRFVGVGDRGRSVAFYRDVLGFQVERDEAVYGPARLQFRDSSELERAVLFFETDDVDDMRAAITARGGNPSEPQKVDWIKMRVFEIRDPDGNILWFGQSYAQPDAVHRGLVEQALPELPFDDVAAAVAYYRDVLGFKINYQQHDLGVMNRDRITILLITRTERHQGIGSASFYIADADALYAEFRAKGANLLGEPVSRPWGLRDFRVLDLAGNRLTFGQPFE